MPGRPSPLGDPVMVAVAAAAVDSIVSIGRDGAAVASPLRVAGAVDAV